ncbi:MAG: sigma 54-interacting transcriptional regulator [Melioribacteraceae bacterium]|nr:sigma 54-interacting transcriptional regulator [Melioribacteraceae bacterium]MCF8356167.1 sigma 54-interacting transcriptional regulator [Melioribacteraceae bacterium]MCF8392333.1 sigma 54-interacting transcriptional regulator [Melioribacteraceae bacterium]MCF8417665.1 sigma 54-interacting transcriptional regulator [Melioribacteraceae bacterium]
MTITDNFKDHILDSIAEGVFTVDRNFKIIFFNKAAEKITGYDRNEVLGKFCKHVFNSKLCYVDCPIALAIKSQKSIFDFESAILQKEGSIIPIKLNAAVLYNNTGDPNGGIISFRDLSEYESIKRKLEKSTQFHGIIGHSKQMHEIFQLIKDIKDSGAPVLIHGESGTGKEMIANAIQATSSRGDNPFIKVNCSVFSDNLLASELFGHVKGAFTDATKDRPGRFEIADKGTIFLDEVAEMPLQMQLQLLRVLQEGTFERVGESVTRKVNVRVIAATNIDIKKALEEGKFRDDLFYRLNVIPIEIPPLRERKDDIPPLVQHFINKFSILYQKEITDIEDRALDLLMENNWKGNVRELENVIEYAFVRSSSNIIEISKLPSTIRGNAKQSGSTYHEIVHDDPEKAKLLKLLEENHWNKTKVAEILGIGRTTLWRKLKSINLLYK